MSNDFIKLVAILILGLIPLFDCSCRTNPNANPAPHTPQSNPTSKPSYTEMLKQGRYFSLVDGTSPRGPEARPASRPSSTYVLKNQAVHKSATWRSILATMAAARRFYGEEHSWGNPYSEEEWDAMELRCDLARHRIANLVNEGALADCEAALLRSQLSDASEYQFHALNIVPRGATTSPYEINVMHIDRIVYPEDWTAYVHLSRDVQALEGLSSLKGRNPVVIKMLLQPLIKDANDVHVENAPVRLEEGKALLAKVKSLLQKIQDNNLPTAGKMPAGHAAKMAATR